MLSIFRRLIENGQRGMGIEYSLVALLTAVAALQILIAFGAKTGSI